MVNPKSPSSDDATYLRKVIINACNDLNWFTGVFVLEFQISLKSLNIHLSNHKHIAQWFKWEHLRTLIRNLLDYKCKIYHLKI